MLKPLSILMCFTWLTSSFAGMVPLIPKCEWNDKVCLIKSTQMAVPIFAHGIPEIAIPPLDPIQIPQVSFEEAGLDMKIKNITVRGLKRCKIIDVTHNFDELRLKYTLQCPVDVRGNYVASGNIFAIPVETKSPFHVHTDKLRITMTFVLSMFTNADGQKHWKLSEQGYTFKLLEKQPHGFKNLLKAAAFILDQNKTELIHTYSKFIVDEVSNKITSSLNLFLDKIPVKNS